MTPIFICSKQRAGNSLILEQLNNSKANCSIFVEPQEFEEYAESYPELGVFNIGQNDRGLPFVRQYMLEYALKIGAYLYWNLDDDVKLYEVIEGKCVPADYTVLYKAQQFFENDNEVAQAGLEYRQFAWSSTKPYSYNSYCDCVVAIKPFLCKDLSFDNDVLLKLDRDFTIQVIKAGFKTMKINKYAFSSPENGSNKGGLYDVYKQNIEVSNSKAMEDKWGIDICRHIVKPNGRNDVKINWKNINKIPQPTLF
jgi:hypothetical protein